MTTFPIDEFKNIETPFYYYDMELLRLTLDEVKKQAGGSKVHYAVKANANPRILAAVREAGLGVDCVSGGEIVAALNAGFSGGDIMFAGVGKTDREIALALDANIHCFNVESLPELLNINEIAGSKHMMAHIAVRINPNVDAHTHQYITTGLSENKFGINLENLDEFVETALSLDNIDLCGVHFHIGSQITETGPFVLLCRKVGEILDRMKALGAEITIVDMGGGFGIDYDDPDGNPIPDFEHYFAVFRDNLQLSPDQELHFEPGRSIVGQCGSLITRVLYVKEGTAKKFAIVDAGMTDLIRPALYQAHHKIENISSTSAVDDVYDVVGPICESSDCFGTDERLPLVQRGDFLALRSAGAYGEIMVPTTAAACRAVCFQLTYKTKLQWNIRIAPKALAVRPSTLRQKTAKSKTCSSMVAATEICREYAR